MTGQRENGRVSCIEGTCEQVGWTRRLWVRGLRDATKPGSGASVEFQIKAGPITMLGVTTKADGSFKFVVAECESRRHKIPPTGNTNTHGHFGPSVRNFLDRWFSQGPTHHFALGIGHHTEDIWLVGEALGTEVAIVPTAG